MSDPPPQDESGPETASILEAFDLPDATRILVHGADTLPARYRDAAGPVFRSLAERALLVARPRDVVCLAHTVPKAALERLARLGVGPGPERIVVPAGDPDAELLERVVADPGAVARLRALLPPGSPVVLEPYLLTVREHRLAEALGGALGRRVDILGGPEVVAHANEKHRVRAEALALGVPVAPGEVVDLGRPGNGDPDAGARLAAALRRWVRPTGRAILRGSVAAGGSSTAVVAPDGIDAAVARALAEGENRLFLVESLLAVSASPNVLMHLPEQGPVRCVGASDQLLDAELRHHGNAFPSRARTLDAMLEHAQRLATSLRDRGGRGLVGLDFLEVTEPGDGGPRPVFAELNARLNGAVYPRALFEALERRARRRGEPSPRAFAAAAAAVPPRSWAALEACEGELAFDPARARGTVPYQPGALAWGQLTAVAFGTDRNDAEARLAALHARAREARGGRP